MAPVIILIVAWWAGSGIVSRAKAKRAAGPGQTTASSSGPGAAAKTTAPNAAAATTRAAQSRRPLAPGDVTFRQWQRSLYDRSKKKLRSHTFGKRGGGKAKDLLGDFTAAAIAGSLAFGMGFALGGAWAGARTAQRKTRKQSPAGTPKSRTAGPGAGPRPRAGGRQATNKPSDPSGTDDVIDAEIVDDAESPPPAPSPYANAEDAVLTGIPELLAYYPTASNGDLMAEILNIHHLLDYAKTVIATATDSAEQATIRANSAGERADQSGNRSITAGNRVEQAGLVASDATAQATQLEETATRFGGLNMDSASLTSIVSAIESANALAADERRRAEAEANVAACAAALAQAEEVAAAAAAASAKSAMAHVEQVKNMHDTVQTRQMPHAEAQAATGNAAAHASLLAAS